MAFSHEGSVNKPGQVDNSRDRVSLTMIGLRNVVKRIKAYRKVQGRQDLACCKSLSASKYNLFNLESVMSCPIPLKRYLR
jgi:hypothetical protein